MPSNIICQRCQCINEPYASTCQRCGARFCPTCKLVIDSPNAKICPHCGKPDMSFKPGKYAGSTYVAQGVSGAPASQNYCSNCGSRVEPGVKKCPFCGRLGTLVTQVPRQGYGVMKPAHGGPDYSYTAVPEPEQTTTQKVCSKCGRQIPAGSSLCPVHGKFGGGSTLKQGFTSRDTSIEAEAYRKMAARGTEAADQTRAHTHRTPPEDTYPQMVAGQAMPPEAGARRIETQPDVQESRTCPNCGSSVPDRSKVCPNCGFNRLPPQNRRPIFKAEAFYKSREASTQAYPAYMPPADQYYGQPAAQPYEESYPASTPGFIEEIQPDKTRKKDKKTKEATYKDASRGQRKSPWPMLLALIALAGVIIIAIVLIMDMLKTPAPITTLPSNTKPGTVATMPPVISNIQFSDIGKTSATVTWTTDKKANSIVIYCLEEGNLCENAKDDAEVTSHSIKLTGLEQGKAYHITVKSMVNDVDASLDAANVLITTDVSDTTPPVISNVKPVNIVSGTTQASAMITWTTDEPSSSLVDFGTSQMYGSTQTDSTMVKYHEVSLNGLPIQSTINYKVTSRDADGNVASSANATFVTPARSGSAIGDSAPDFTLTCADGSEITLNSLRGKKVILNFWSLNCEYCKQEMPFFQQLHEQLPDIPILAVCGPQMAPVNKPVIGNYLTTNNFELLVPLDETGSVGLAYNVTDGVPVTFFIDASGIIKNFKNGAFMSSSDEIETMLNSYN